MRRPLIALLIAAAGCTSPQSENPYHPRLDAGPEDNTWDPPPPPPQLDSGTSNPLDASDDSAVPDPSPNFVLECSGAITASPLDDVLSTWQAERADHLDQEPLGYSASFALDATSYRVSGRTNNGSVEAPFSLRMNGNTQGLIGFEDAEVEGIDEMGRVELYAGSTAMGELGHARVTAGSIQGLSLNVLSVEGGMLSGGIELVTEELGTATTLNQTHASVSDLTIEQARVVYLYPEGTSGLEERVEWMPTGPVVIRSAASFAFYDDDDVSLERDLSSPIELEYEAFGVAGDFSGGSLEIADLDVNETPLAVFGTSAQLRVGASSIESLDDVRVTQAVNEVGLMIPAAVEIVATATEVWVRPNETRVIELHYRERSYLGDAVLGEIQIGGEAEALLELQTVFDLSSTRTAQIIDAVIDTGWAAPLVGIAALPTVSIVFVIDIFDCIFGGCPAQPDPLVPFPQWLPAGEIGTMEVRVKGALGVGTYETTLTFVGRNYCPVTVPLTVHVGEPPASDAGIDAGDDAGEGGAPDAS